MSCEQSEVVHFTSLDKTQQLTVIDRGDFRYLIDGHHSSVPKSNFIKLSVEKIDPVSDCIHICWKNERYDWEVVIDKSVEVESKLDTGRFKFNTSLPVDDRGIPTEKKFRQEKCAIFSYYLMRLTPDTGAIVDIE
tara:strand:- start:1205 stop:1609 length:405 start_codon:yes stop_codon:yes gene_type:complete